MLCVVWPCCRQDRHLVHGTVSLAGLPILPSSTVGGVKELCGSLVVINEKFFFAKINLSGTCCWRNLLTIITLCSGILLMLMIYRSQLLAIIQCFSLILVYTMLSSIVRNKIVQFA